MMTARKYFCKNIIKLLATAVKQALHIHPIINNHHHSKLTFRSLVNVLEVSMAYTALYPPIYPGWVSDDWY
jgi:light-regulated signal transduction histidine kinase (bacteriophytochrome)